MVFFSLNRDGCGKREDFILLQLGSLDQEPDRAHTLYLTVRFKKSCFLVDILLKRQRIHVLRDILAKAFVSRVTTHLADEGPSRRYLE